MAGIAYSILLRTIVAVQGLHSMLGEAVGRDVKGKTSLALYLIAIPSALIHEWIAGALYVIVALIWLIPDRRIERKMAAAATPSSRGH